MRRNLAASLCPRVRELATISRATFLETVSWPPSLPWFRRFRLAGSDPGSRPRPRRGRRAARSLGLGRGGGAQPYTLTRLLKLHGLDTQCHHPAALVRYQRQPMGPGVVIRDAGNLAVAVVPEDDSAAPSIELAVQHLLAPRQNPRWDRKRSTDLYVGDLGPSRSLA